MGAAPEKVDSIKENIWTTLRRHYISAKTLAEDEERYYKFVYASIHRGNQHRHDCTVLLLSSVVFGLCYDGILLDAVSASRSHFP